MKVGNDMRGIQEARKLTKKLIVRESVTFLTLISAVVAFLAIATGAMA